MKKLIMETILVLVGVVIIIFAEQNEFILKHPEVWKSILIFVFISISLLVAIVKKIAKSDYKENISMEEIPEEFERKYEELYENHIQSLEKMRKKARVGAILEYLIIVFIILLEFLSSRSKTVTSNQWEKSFFLIIMVGMIISSCIILVNRKKRRKYVEMYKKEVVSNFIQMINSELEYKTVDCEDDRSEEDYKMANFETKRFNEFFSDDYIEGFVDTNMFMKMSDLHIQNITGTGKDRNVEEIFQGLFAQTKGNRDIKTCIRISRNKLKMMDVPDRVEMDNVEFEKYFDVYSKDKIKTMQILTSDIMELLIDFYNKYELEYEIVLKNNAIYMRFFTGPMFEPKILGSSMDKELLYMYFSVLKFVVAITKKVNETVQNTEI